MLTVAKLTQGQERYYERSVAQGLDDYYAGRGESPGVWAGAGAAGLGLKGVVADGQLGDLCRGLDPSTGERLRRPARARTITVERIDPYAGTSRLEARKLAPVCGYDLVFSAPKSVSLLHALGDQRVRHEVNQAHLAAWQAALAYLERDACVVRKGRNGIDREHGEGFLAAAFQHRTSRAEDPQLHTHVIVANMARTPSDGKWRALDGAALLKTYRLAAGYLYQAQLRHELAARLGVRWQEPVKGMAEIDGVPTAVLREFSRRRLQVEQHLAAEATSGYYAGRVAALATRERKREIDLPRATSEWRARAAEHGFGQPELAGLLHRTTQTEPSRDELRDTAHRLAGPAGLTEKRTAFIQPELLMAWAEAARQGIPAEQIDRVCDRFLALDAICQVTSSNGAGRPARYSTRELIDTEHTALALAKDGTAIGAPTATVDPERASGRVPLSAEQLEVAAAVTASPDRVVCVVGRAGAGKTTTMHAVVDAYRAARTPVLGVAPSGAAARALTDGTGIHATTLHALTRLDRLPPRAVLLVDEAGMADTRTLTRALELVAATDGKAILVGDPHQLPAVGAGGLFAAIVERHGASELTENRRQHDPVERELLDRIRTGTGRDYVAHAQGAERIVTADPATTRARLLADWWQYAKHDPAGNAIIALRRRDVTELNQLARRLMDTAGKLGPDRLTTPNGELATSDRVVCKRNNTTIGITNGTLGTVARIDSQRRSIDLRTDNGRTLTIPAAYLDRGDLRHAYALTGHTTQGLTVDRAFVLTSGEARMQEWGYVALSRARTATRLYVPTTEIAREVHAPTPEPTEPLTRLAEALEASQRERLATDQQPLSGGRRHDVSPVVERRVLDEVARERLRLLDRERLALRRSLDLAERRPAKGGHARPRLLDRALGGEPDGAVGAARTAEIRRRLAELDRERSALTASPDAPFRSAIRLASDELPALGETRRPPSLNR